MTFQIGEYTIEDLGNGEFRVTKPAYGQKQWTTVLAGGDLETFLSPIFAGSKIELINP